MAVHKPLVNRVMGISITELTKNEATLFEAILLLRICEELKADFRVKYQPYFKMLHYTKEMEKRMLTEGFVSMVIRDMIVTEEYTLQGLARYTDTPLEVIEEIIIGKNTQPSAELLQRVISLHYAVRRELYNGIIKKIILER